MGQAALQQTEGRLRTSMRIITAPACWARALTDCDQSGMTADDIIALNAFLARELLPGESVVSEVAGQVPRFVRYYSTYDQRFKVGDVMDFLVLEVEDA
jgi:hypothetical protein